MKFWSDLSALSGATLKTLGMGKPFDVMEINEKYVVIRPSATGLERQVKRKDFEDAFNQMCLQGSINLKGIRLFSEMNPVYIAAMLAQLSYVTSTVRPINLRFVSSMFV